MKKIIVVGGGASGSVFAARLSENPSNCVHLIEAGKTDSETVERYQDSANLKALTAEENIRENLSVNLTATKTGFVPRGRILGGSMAINGAYFMRPRKSDFLRWEKVGGETWGYENAKRLFKKIEDATPITTVATSGKVADPLSAAFLNAALEKGFHPESDKNATDKKPGAGETTLNVLNCKKMHPGVTYVLAAAARRNLKVTGDTFVTKIIFDGQRAVGVETVRDGVASELFADEIILAAGAPGTARLLLESEIVGVGENFSDHPSVTVEWVKKPEAPRTTAHSAFSVAINFDSKIGQEHPDGDLEILFSTRSAEELFSGVKESDKEVAASMHLLVSLQRPVSRGRVRLNRDDPGQALEINYRYLEDKADTERLKLGVHEAVKVLQNEKFAEFFQEIVSPTVEELADDDLLNEWVNANISTSIHMSGTAQVGVLAESSGRIKDTMGLWCCDTSILPDVPSRGTAYAAVFTGELVAKAVESFLNEA